MGWNNLAVLFAVAAVLCAVGFYKYIYFLSIGYGFAIAGLGLALLAMFPAGHSVLHTVLCLLFVLYGARLSGFLLIREHKSAAYSKTLNAAMQSEKGMPFFVKAAIWISVSALYVAQVSPVFYRLYNGTADSLLPWIGILISVFGLLMESRADREKTAQKKSNPNMVAVQGLYHLVRCPNYLGEMIFWTGVTVGGLDAAASQGQLLMMIIAYGSLIGIMVSGAQRLEKRQEAHYGKLPEYRAYADHTPILLPWIPLYHLNKSKAK